MDEVANIQDLVARKSEANMKQYKERVI